MAKVDIIYVLFWISLCVDIVSEKDKFLAFSAGVATLGGRTIVNLRMNNTFGALLDMNNAVKVFDSKL